ncbi:MAG: ATP-binding cassette domain-containing protein, partial [Bacteroidales bacterium]|nr:ATP-binding cassette domain-containing protein [Bacteroidales bacterium]
ITLFSGTILSNIAIGEYSPDIPKIQEIINLLGLNDFVESLPEGLETLVGENGSKLSGGEKQRLAIARAIYKDPEIYIFDEASSALDSIAEKYVLNAVQTLRARGKTIITIAHRLSTIKNSDTIIVMSKGKIMEQGDFQTLINNKGEFYKLWENQVL